MEGEREKMRARDDHKEEGSLLGYGERAINTEGYRIRV